MKRASTSYLTLVAPLAVGACLAGCGDDDATTDAQTITDLGGSDTGDASDTGGLSDTGVALDVALEDSSLSDLGPSDLGATDSPSDAAPTDTAADGAVADAAPSDAPSDAACPGDASVCGGGCVDLLTSAEHCGACGVACASAQTCFEGRCVAGEVFVATLTGAQENPPVTTAASGAASVTLDPATLTIEYALRHTVTGATAAHLHTAPGGANGPVTVGFSSADATVSGTATLSAAQVADLRAGRMYANVHSTVNPGGELRGQLLRPGERLFVAQLSGAQEVPPTTSTAGGPVSVILDRARTGITFEGAVTGGLTGAPTAAHFHLAPLGVSGPVVYPIALTGMTFQGTQTVTAADVSALTSGNWYVNVHTAMFPGGEIRGQLTAR